MATEKEWVRSLQPRLDDALRACGDGEWNVHADAGEKLTYAHEIMRYNTEGPDQRHSARYETDLLVYDIRDNGDWIPRVVLECKTWGVSTHDALTYSAKAATHKHVHPYLRYGILIGDFGTALPGRLIRHGAYFDFMMVWSSQEPTNDEWSELVELLKDEVQASRTLQALLTENRTRGRKKFRLLHRPLRWKESEPCAAVPSQAVVRDQPENTEQSS
jgi:hypothetical protein